MLFIAIVHNNFSKLVIQRRFQFNTGFLTLFKNTHKVLQLFSRCPECREGIQIVHQLEPDFSEIISVIESARTFTNTVGQTENILALILGMFDGQNANQQAIEPNQNVNAQANEPNQGANGQANEPNQVVNEQANQDENENDRQDDHQEDHQEDHQDDHQDNNPNQDDVNENGANNQDNGQNEVRRQRRARRRRHLRAILQDLLRRYNRV